MKRNIFRVLALVLLTSILFGCAAKSMEEDESFSESLYESLTDSKKATEKERIKVRWINWRFPRSREKHLLWVGLYGYEEKDLERYLVDWGYDFIKVDWCGGEQLKLDQETAYTNIGEIIKVIEEVTGRDKIYNVCSWAFPGEWVVDVADSWRTGADIHG